MARLCNVLPLCRAVDASPSENKAPLLRAWSKAAQLWKLWADLGFAHRCGLTTELVIIHILLLDWAVCFPTSSLIIHIHAVFCVLWGLLMVVWVFVVCLSLLFVGYIFNCWFGFFCMWVNFISFFNLILCVCLSPSPFSGEGKGERMILSLFWLCCNAIWCLAITSGGN